MCTLQGSQALGQDHGNKLEGHDKSKILLNDLIYMIQCMVVGTVTITLERGNGNVWRIQSPNKSPVVMVQYENESGAQNERDSNSKAAEIIAKSSGELNTRDEFQTTTPSPIKSINEAETAEDDCQQVKLIPVSIVETTDQASPLSLARSCAASSSEQTPCKIETDSTFAESPTVTKTMFDNVETQLGTSETENSTDRVTPPPIRRQLTFFNAADETFVVDKQQKQHVWVGDGSSGIPKKANSVIKDKCKTDVDSCIVNSAGGEQCVAEFDVPRVELVSHGASKSMTQEPRIFPTPRHQDCHPSDTVISVLGLGSVHNKQIVSDGANLKTNCENRQTMMSNIQKSLYCGDRPFQCSYCKKSFPHLSRLKVHERCHTGERPYQCSYCNKSFTELCNLKSHETLHTGDRPYQCSYCKKSFTHPKTLKVHERTHTGEKPYRCSYCDKSFAQIGNVKLHERTHTGEKPYQCAYCNKSFTQVGNWKEHQKLHTEESSYQCSYCNKLFAYSNTLKVHERTHTGQNSYQCPYCEKAFTHLSKLKVHERTHTGEKPFQCSHCHKSFTQLCYLKVHEALHTGDAPHRCSYCKKSFTHSNTLKVHERTHTGERPYRCSYCESAFAQIGNLRLHERIHTGEKPYRCTYCEKSFSQVGNLKEHEKRHTR